MHPIVFYANYALCSLTQPKRRRNSGVYSGLWSQWPTVLHFFVWLLQPRLGLQHKTVQKGFKRRNISSLEKRISNENRVAKDNISGYLSTNFIMRSITISFISVKVCDKEREEEDPDILWEEEEEEEVL